MTVEEIAKGLTELPNRLRLRVYDGPRSAVWPLAEALGIEPEAALGILRAIVRAGFVVAPRVPTDAMLVAYFDSYGAQPVTPSGVVRGIGKARKRWEGMGSAGTAVALSRRYPPDALLTQCQSDGASHGEPRG